MAGDLGMREDEVDPRAQEILDFWFGLTKEQQFARDDALDAGIAERFGALREQVKDSDAAGWRDRPATLLAAVILLDQFSRNLHRGSAEAFGADPLARELTGAAILHGWDREMPAAWRVFLYMPLMHSEDAATQAHSVAMFEDLGEAENLTFARDHADVFARFGRFPSRNAALGRESSAAEQAYLEEGGGW